MAARTCGSACIAGEHMRGGQVAWLTASSPQEGLAHMGS